jgi:hypothetical protein
MTTVCCIAAGEWTGAKGGGWEGRKLSQTRNFTPSWLLEFPVSAFMRMTQGPGFDAPGAGQPQPMLRES